MLSSDEILIQPLGTSTLSCMSRPAVYTEYTDIFCCLIMLPLYQTSEPLVNGYLHGPEVLKCKGKHIGKLVGAKPTTYAEQLMFFYYQISGSLCQNATSHPLD